MIAAPPSGHSRMPSSPEPVPAATILMLRDGPEGLEVFMVVRHHQIDFASGALVFPGGKVDPGDAVVRDHCDGADDLDERDLAMRVGAIREAFEECGILLARPRGDTALVSGARLEALDAYRDKLHSGELSLADFLEQEQLTLALDTLTRFAHWITPEMMPKRFDTDFFVAAAPADHVALHDGQKFWLVRLHGVFDHLRVKHGAPLGIQADDFRATAVRNLTQQMPEAPKHWNKDFVSRLDH